MKINFASTRLAFSLIAFLLGLLLLSAIITQKDISDAQVVSSEETLGPLYVMVGYLQLDRIYSSPYFFTLLGLLGINLIVGNIKRFRSVFRLEGTLLKARHLGSIIFHLSLIIIMIGVILNYLYKFAGVFGLTEGQTAGDNHNGYHRIYTGPFNKPQSDRFDLTLDKFSTDYSVGENVTEAAAISVKGQSGRDTTATIYHNRPLQYHGIEFHLGKGNGYSPEMVVFDSSGSILFKSFIRLSAQMNEGETVHYDYTIIQSISTKIGIEALPRGDALDSIQFKITVEKGTNVMYNGSVELNDTVEFGGLTLTIPRVRRWSYIEAQESPYLTLIFFGFWSALGGMTVGFLPRLLGAKSGIR